MALEGSAIRSAQLLKLPVERGSDQGYLPKPAKSLFISDSLDQEEAAKRQFSAERLEPKFVGGSWYLGGYLGPQEELEAWVTPKVEACAHGFRTLGKISKQHPR